LEGKKYDNPSQKTDFFDFIDSFGTHFVNEIRMGARFGARTKIKSENLTKLRSNSILFKRSLGIEKVAKFSASVENTNEQTSKLDSLFEETKVYSIGSPIPKDLKAETWVAESVKNPMPIKYKLIPLDELLDGKRLKFKADAFQSIKNIKDIASNLKKAINGYCKDYLLPKGEVASCDQTNPDMVINTFISEPFKPVTQFFIKNYETGTCITPNGENDAATVNTCNGDKRQSFYFVSGTNRDGWSMISNPPGEGRDMTLDNFHGQSDEDTTIYSHPNVNHRNQAWEVIQNPDKTITLKSRSGKCLQPKGGNPLTGTFLVINSCNGFEVQKWVLLKGKD